MVRSAHILIACAAALLGLGVVMVHSAGSVVGGPEGAVVESTFGPAGPWTMFATRASLYAGIAIAVMLVLSKLNVRQLFTARGLSSPLLVLLLGALALQGLTMVPGFGHEVNGAHRWLKVGPITFQPSELVKWVMVLAVAWWCARRAGVMQRFGSGALPAIGLIGLACGLVVREDLGTAVLIGMVAVLMLIAGGMRLWVLVPVFVVGAVGIVAAILAAPYRIKRLMIYRDPWIDPQGAGYHPIQSQLAFAEGGVSGSGLGHSVQKYYIPEDTTDFIFPVLTEELGLAGAALVIGLFLTILWVGLGIIRDSKDPFSRLVGLGILATLGIQAAINLAVVTVVVPTKGIALPLVSNGGTGWIMTAGALGLLAAIDNATALEEAEASTTDSADDADTEVESSEPTLRLTG
ncbi:MAG: FtsW/RodA/SpoVE family cell cycle protein [Phycisphaeraceae bacterium]